MTSVLGKRKMTAKERSAKKPRYMRRLFTSPALSVPRHFSTTNRSAGPIPPRMVTKHRFVEEVASDGTTATRDNVYNLNSTFAPSVVGGSAHQPYGRDTYAGLYNRYRVFAVRYKVIYTSNSTTNPFRGIIMWNNDGTAETNWGLINERPTSRVVTFSANQHRTLSGKLSLPFITGVEKTQYASDDRFQATAGASPTEAIKLHVFMSDATGAAIAAGTAYVRVILTYYTEWFDPLNLAQS